MSWNPFFGLLLLSTTMIDYFTGLKISRAEDLKNKKYWLGLSLICNLGCLFAFKYFLFFYNSSLFFIHKFSQGDYNVLETIIIPVGLSFYTFQSLGYIIDVYRGDVKPELNPGRFALFVSFFPQLVAGPVERFAHLLPQLYKKTNIDVALIRKGVGLMTWGFFKKIVIADRLANFVNPVFSNVEHYSGLTLLIIGFFFVVEIYCDFSGYTDIARGTANLFGIDLLINFNRPLLSKSLYEFWKRWHISMTNWFRTYLYITMGGNKVSYNKWLFNILIVFLISGLWHGANWTFLVWGAMHGIMYIIEMMAKEKLFHSRGFSSPLGEVGRGLFAWLYFVFFITLSFIVFRANTIQDVNIIYSKFFSFNFKPILCLEELKSINHIFPLAISVFLIAFLFITELYQEHGLGLRSFKYERFLKPAFYIMVFVMLFVFGQFNASEFIYFKF